MANEKDTEQTVPENKKRAGIAITVPEDCTLQELHALLCRGSFALRRHIDHAGGMPIGDSDIMVRNHDGKLKLRCLYEIDPEAHKTIKIRCSEGSAYIWDEDKDEIMWSMDLSYSDEVIEKLYQLLEMFADGKRVTRITFPGLEAMDMEK